MISIIGIVALIIAGLFLATIIGGIYVYMNERVVRKQAEINAEIDRLHRG